MSKSTSDLLRKSILVAIGATAVTIDKVNSLIDDLVEKGEMSENQAKSFKEEVKQKAISEKDSLEKKISEQVSIVVEKVAKEMGLVTKKDLEELEEKILSKCKQEHSAENPPENNCCCQ